MQNYEDWIGMTAIDMNGEEVGTIADLYTEEGEGGNPEAQPKWATIQSGMFGTKTSFAPLDGAEVTEDGITLQVTAEKVTSAPSIDTDGSLSNEEEDVLYQHYGMSLGDGSEDETELSSDTDDSNDDEVASTTRYAEELKVGKETHETGRMRLHKYVERKPVQLQGEVEREVLRVERHPVSGGEAGSVKSGISDDGEDSEEIVLRETVPVVEKREAVAKEQVTLHKDTVREKTTLDEEVKEERVDVEDSSNR